MLVQGSFDNVLYSFMSIRSAMVAVYQYALVLGEKCFQWKRRAEDLR